ncbi:MAG: hypothetical protein Q4E62_01945 [Sutterellaceae bacterium]|nr:hypothetical protein [Sutterellaceae bacterium]
MSISRRIFPTRWRAYFRHPRIRGLFVSAFWAVTLFYFVFCALILATRWYLLPQIDRYKGDIASALSKTLDSQVQIGEIHPKWDTFWPQLELSDVRIHKSSSRTAERRGASCTGRVGVAASDGNVLLAHDFRSTAF